MRLLLKVLLISFFPYFLFSFDGDNDFVTDEIESLLGTNPNQFNNFSGYNDNKTHFQYAFNLNDQWDQYLDSYTNAEVYSEIYAGNSKFWRPTSAGVEGLIVYKFSFDKEISEAKLHAQLYAWTDGADVSFDSSARAFLECSIDGINWELVNESTPPNASEVFPVVDISSIVSGHNDLYLRARLLSSRSWGSDGLIFSQFLRTNPNNMKSFVLDVDFIDEESVSDFVGDDLMIPSSLNIYSEGSGIIKAYVEFPTGNGTYDPFESFTDALNGVYDEGEDFVDYNGDGEWGQYYDYIADHRSEYYDEPFTDALNGEYDEGEEFVDVNGDGVWGTYEEWEVNEWREFYDEPFTDALNGEYDEGEDFVDVNGDGVWGTYEEPYFDEIWDFLPEPFTDGNNNGVYDEGEYFEDYNGDGVRGWYEDVYYSEGSHSYDEPFTDALNGVYDGGEDFVDISGDGEWGQYEEIYYEDWVNIYDEPFTDALNGVYDEGEEFVDIYGDGRWGQYEDHVYDEHYEYYDEPFTDALNGVYDEGEDFADSQFREVTIDSLNLLYNGENFILSAIPETGHDFVNWSDGYSEISSEKSLYLSYTADTYSVYKAKFSNNLDNAIDEFNDALSDVEDEVDSIIDGSDDLDNSLDTVEDEIDNILDSSNIDNSLDALEDAATNIEDEIDDLLSSDNIEDEVDEEIESLEVVYMFGSKPEKGGARFLNTDSVSLGIFEGDIYSPISEEEEVENNIFLSGVVAGYGTVDPSDYLDKVIWMRVFNNLGDTFYIRDTSWPKFQNVTVDEYGRLGRDFTINGGTAPSDIVISPLGNQGVNIITNDGINGEGLSLNFSGVVSGLDNALVDALMASRDAAIAERDAANNDLVAAIAERDAAIAERDAANNDLVAAISERDTAILERDAAIADYYAAVTDYAVVVAQTANDYDALTIALADAVAERDAAIIERDSRPTRESYNLLQAESENKHSLEEIRDLRPGSKMIQVIDNKINLSMVIEESDDLNSWNEGSTMNMEIPIEEGSNKKFYRFKMNDSESESSDGYANSVFSIVEGGYTWHEAKVDAESRGGRLAVLSTEMSEIRALNIINQFDGPLWIGLTDEETEGEYKWINGESLTYSNWWNGFPSNSSLENYVHINWINRNDVIWYNGPYQQDQRRWNDASHNDPNVGPIDPNYQGNHNYSRGYLLEVPAP